MSLFRNQTLDSPKLTILHKTLKAARRAMADRVILNRTNTAEEKKRDKEAKIEEKRQKQRLSCGHKKSYAART